MTIKEKQVLKDKFTNSMMEFPSLLGIKAYPFVHENGNISLGAKTMDDKIFGTFEEAVNWACDLLVDEHYERLSKELDKIRKRAIAKEEKRNKNREDDEFKRKINSLFSQILNNSKNLDEAMTTLNFFQLDERNYNKTIQWNDEKISKELIVRINKHFK